MNFLKKAWLLEVEFLFDQQIPVGGVYVYLLLSAWEILACWTFREIFTTAKRKRYLLLDFSQTQILVCVAQFHVWDFKHSDSVSLPHEGITHETTSLRQTQRYLACNTLLFTSPQSASICMTSDSSVLSLITDVVTLSPSRASHRTRLWRDCRFEPLSSRKMFI